MYAFSKSRDFKTSSTVYQQGDVLTKKQQDVAIATLLARSALI